MAQELVDGVTGLFAFAQGFGVEIGTLEETRSARSEEATLSC